jgi:hypothetical protein
VCASKSAYLCSAQMRAFVMSATAAAAESTPPLTEISSRSLTRPAFCTSWIDQTSETMLALSHATGKAMLAQTTLTKVLCSKKDPSITTAPTPKHQDLSHIGIPPVTAH